jgi:hypothetical protein
MLGLFVQAIFTILVREFSSTGLVIATAIALPFTLLVLLRPYAPAILSGIANRVDGVKIEEVEAGSQENRYQYPGPNGPNNSQSEMSEELVEVLSRFGVTDGSPQLKDSKYEPLSIIQSTQQSLLYMGIAAPKWIEERGTREEFRNMLRRVNKEEGAVRFLLLDPEWDGYEEYITLEESIEQTVSHFKYFLQLESSYGNFSVRLYRSIPTCRIIFKDNDFVAVSRYRFEDEIGWQHPHLEITTDSDYTLSTPLKQFYNLSWEQARPIHEYASHIPSEEDI